MLVFSHCSQSGLIKGEIPNSGQYGDVGAIEGVVIAVREVLRPGPTVTTAGDEDCMWMIRWKWNWRDLMTDVKVQGNSRREREH